MKGKRIKIESLLKPDITIMLTMIAVFTSCSQKQIISEQENQIEVTGIIQVLSEGTRSETVIIEDTASGITYALVGENAVHCIRDFLGCWMTDISRVCNHNGQGSSTGE